MSGIHPKQCNAGKSNSSNVSEESPASDASGEAETKISDVASSLRSFATAGGRLYTTTYGEYETDLTYRGCEWFGRELNKIIVNFSLSESLEHNNGVDKFTVRGVVRQDFKIIGDTLGPRVQGLFKVAYEGAMRQCIDEKNTNCTFLPFISVVRPIRGGSANARTFCDATVMFVAT